MKYLVTLKHKFTNKLGEVQTETRSATSPAVNSKKEAELWLEEREMNRYGKRYIETISVKAEKL